MTARHPFRQPVLLCIFGLILLAQPTAGQPVGTRFAAEAKTEEILSSAREAFVARNYRLAEVLYKSVLVRQPNHIKAMLELSVVYEATGQYQYAKGLLSRASTISPHDEEIIRRNAEIMAKMSRALEAEVDSLLRHGAYDQALPKLSALLTTRPEDADLYYERAVCHMELGHADAALAEIDKALTLRADAKYHKLKRRASVMLEANEIHRLTLEAKRQLRIGTWEADQRALDIIGEILEIDPDDEWAAARFAAMKKAAGGAGGRAAGGAALGKLRSAAMKVAGHIGNAVVASGRILGDNLGIVILILLPFVMLNSPVTRSLARVIGKRFAPRGSLSGHLECYSIHEILTLINSHGRTGELRIKSDAGKGSVFFKRGEVYHCSCENMVGDKALQHVVKKAKEGDFAFRESSITKHETVNTPLSLILMGLPERSEAITTKKLLESKKRSKMSSLLRDD